MPQRPARSSWGCVAHVAKCNYDRGRAAANRDLVRDAGARFSKRKLWAWIVRARPPMRRALLALTAICAGTNPAFAVDPVPSFRYLVTGNGHGFAVFDVTQNAIKQFLE